METKIVETIKVVGKGRPKKYLTEEEAREAKLKKDRENYEKRVKDMRKEKEEERR